MALQLTITGTASEMQGVGRLDDGRAVFVPGALPEERVEIEIVRQQARYAVARLARVLESSPQRRTGDCPYAGECGGCQARHMTYGLSLALKRRRVADALARIAGFDAPQVLEPVGMAKPERYRNKAEYAIEGGQIGLRRADGRGILPVSDCVLQAESSVRALVALRAWLKEHPQTPLRYLVTRVNHKGDVMAILSHEGPFDAADAAGALAASLSEVKSLYACRLRPGFAHALDGDCRLISGKAALADELDGLELTLAPQTFFQVNSVQAEVLYKTVAEFAALTGRELVVDAYCGAGSIGLYLARRAARVVGIEIIPQAVADARESARRAGLGRVAEFVEGRAERVLPDILEKGLQPDVVVVDPPRKGLDAALTRALVAAAPPKIIYVSCDPGTLARDLKNMRAGGYRPKSIQPVDMFPWTSHVETVVLMSRAEK
jgi:23S rRNA (uracil1939-C5)-methyltransferase